MKPLLWSLQGRREKNDIHVHNEAHSYYIYLCLKLSGMVPLQQTRWHFCMYLCGCMYSVVLWSIVLCTVCTNCVNLCILASENRFKFKQYDVLGSFPCAFELELQNSFCAPQKQCVALRPPCVLLRTPCVASTPVCGTDVPIQALRAPCSTKGIMPHMYQ